MLLEISICTFISIVVSGQSIVTETYPVATTPYITISSRHSRGVDTSEVMTMDSSKAVKNDPWQGYYDFLINEGSFKFWAVFQVVTAAILIYSAFAAVYYAKYNFVQADYDYSDYFFGRSDSYSNNMWSGLNAQTFQRILDAISSNKYS